MKYFVANWKMNMNLSDVDSWVRSWREKKVDSDVEIIVAPTDIYLFLLSSLPEIKIASQNVSSFDKGAHTGYTGTFQLKDICKYVIIGHSERGESYETVMPKKGDGEIYEDSGYRCPRAHWLTAY